jgi:hypothetical protein
LSTPISLNDPFTLFLFVIATVMMVGFGVGRWVNQRRTQQISGWLEPGLRSLGGTPTVQRVSRSAFRFQMTNTRRPFKTVTTSVVLISREVLPIWVWERLSGHQDLLIFHVTFRQSPTLEVEIIDPRNELGRRGEMQAREHDWPAWDFSTDCRLYHAPQTSPPDLEAIASYVALSPFEPRRVALRRNAPHMLVSMPIPNLEQADSMQLVKLLLKLARLTHSASGGT